MAYKTRKAELQEQNKTVTSPIARLDKDITKVKCGRKKMYTPLKMKNEINRYFEFCENADEMPSIKGLMIHLKMYKEQFYRYIHKYPEFAEILEHTRMIIANWAENDVYNTKGLAAGKIAYMKNIHGWADKLETNNTTEIRQISVDEAKAKIEMLAPKLLEALKNNELLKQLTKRESIEAELVEGEVA